MRRKGERERGMEREEGKKNVIEHAYIHTCTHAHAHTHTHTHAHTHGHTCMHTLTDISAYALQLLMY